MCRLLHYIPLLHSITILI